MNYDAWKTYTPDQYSECDECCECESCHEDHVSSHKVHEFYKFFECCREQMAEWIKKGERCAIHPKSYAEPGYCEGCDEEAHHAA